MTEEGVVQKHEYKIKLLKHTAVLNMHVVSQERLCGNCGASFSKPSFGTLFLKN